MSTAEYDYYELSQRSLSTDILVELVNFYHFSADYNINRSDDFNIKVSNSIANGVKVDYEKLVGYESAFDEIRELLKEKQKYKLDYL